MSIQKRIQVPGVYRTSLKSCNCLDFIYRGGSYHSSGKSICKHMRRLEQEISYFHSAWNQYANNWICFCQDFECDGDCHHIQALIEIQTQVPAALIRSGF
jgi:hypothetical protein